MLVGDGMARPPDAGGLRGTRCFGLSPYGVIATPDIKLKPSSLGVN
jgi:hypothetical protein